MQLSLFEQSSILDVIHLWIKFLKFVKIMEIKFH